MKGDEELLTMNRIDRLLCGLDPSARMRVLAWLNSRHANPADKGGSPPGGPVAQNCRHTGYTSAERIGQSG